MKRLLGLLLALSAGPALALAPDDFAYGLRLEPSREAPLYRLAVPEDVYLISTRPGLGDLRVFDARGARVLHALLAPAAEVHSHTRAVPLFPLPAVEPDRTLALDVRTDAKGAVIAVAPGPAADAVPGGYLLDLSKLEQPVSGLQLDWSATQPFAASVQILASDDLQDWRPLLRSTLADLQYQDHRLRQDRLDLPLIRARYLRIDWPEPAVELVDAQVSLRETQAPVWQWRTLTAHATTPEGLLYDAGGVLPVQRLELAFAARNQLLSARLEVAPDPAGPWRPVHSGLFYHLDVGDAALASRPASVPLVQFRYWRLRSRDGGPPTISPQLRLGWQPQHLVFLGQGTPPYLLAYGRAGLAASEADIAGLLGAIDPQRKNAIVDAVVGERLVLAGPPVLTAPVQLPWRTWLLWTALIGAALMLAIMATRLLREMSDAPAG